MKKQRLKDVKQILRSFFTVVFAILLITLFITSATTAADRSGFQLTGKKYERISAEDIKNSCISLADMIK